LTRDPIPSNLPLQGVKLIPPHWNRSSIINLYRQADLFVLPSRLETWGDVLLEAMAFGLPCIGVRDDAMGEIITHQQTGLLVQPGNIDDLTNALFQLLSDPTMRVQYGTAARQRIEETFTWELVAERLTKILNNIGNKNGSTDFAD
jgi:glycosyltransferase involved in cell wall biosynthesis